MQQQIGQIPSIFLLPQSWSFSQISLTLILSLHCLPDEYRMFLSLEKNKTIPALIAGWFIENLTEQDNLLRHKIVSSFSMLQTHEAETKAKSQFPT